MAQGCKRCSTFFSKDDSREKAQLHLKKLQGQHKKAATEAVLAAQNLNSEDHQKLLGKPANLIILLYQHSSVAERIQNPTGRDYPGELRLCLLARTTFEGSSVEASKVSGLSHLKPDF